MSAPIVSIVWFRQDLRLADNPALRAAARAGRVVPVYLWSPGEDAPWQPGAASRWWLRRSLEALDGSLRRIGSRLILLEGSPEAVLRPLARRTGATHVCFNRRYEPAAIRTDARVTEALSKDGLRVESFDGALLHDPRSLRTKQGGPYGVFTPFYRACLAGSEPPAPLPAPDRLAAPRIWPASTSIDSLGLDPVVDWAASMRAEWAPGEAGARSRLRRFVKKALVTYETDRDRPDLSGTSALSPHLHYGEISPAAVLRAARSAAASRTRGGVSRGEEKFTSELYWREFAHHLLAHHPRTPDEPLRESFKRMPWKTDRRLLAAWRTGRTGYPFVDAGMRQLWAVGWMHNRARMVAASFLVKHLLISWKEGARWFWDTLVDADLASNTLGWQWVAGCGADAAPFFRIFNPVTQSEKFDPTGAYIRKWVPELGRLDAPWIHRPWEAPVELLERAGIRLGRDYPDPIVEHAKCRRRALAAYDSIRVRPSADP